MKVEVLASVMNASLPETVQHMNLQSDAVIINQCDRLGQEEMHLPYEVSLHSPGITTDWEPLHIPPVFPSGSYLS